MSDETNKENNEENPQEYGNAVTTKHVKMNSNLILPQQFSTVHIDNAMVAIDHGTQTATLTLLTSHPIPKFSEGWGLDNITWEMVGEIKMPLAVMSSLSVYFMSVMSGGLDVLRLIQEQMMKNKTQPPQNGTTYGPFSMKLSTTEKPKND
ncbi:hypothetical protein [Candidatus Nitrosocosmicus arcticus]|uniref:Uncharacterized protein n=1 Tax=Candidatus Nitrosocosmicus arcticus TaxID=2035267 RepID=A0A557SV95_9ARCH|nr:hypothetical protein [Candidatus Nitrosocosmicus arcticus]TVP40534.1 hypothetical protein NARC_70115 [Candidatus Nitrosocosmicus arcticus]